MNYRVITKAGITQSEFGKLAGVSRVTANKWMHGSEPHKLAVDKIADLLRAIEDAVEEDRLPLPQHIAREERYTAIRERLNLPVTH